MTYAASIPFREAIAIAQRKGMLRSNLSSAQLSRLESRLKQRSIFSARMDKASVLQVLLKNLTQMVSNEGIEDENGRLRSVVESKAQLKEAMYKAGVRLAPVGTPKVLDFYSDTRRELMVRTTLLDTLGFARHVAGQDPVALELNPGLELVRMVIPKGGEAAERDWYQRWMDAREVIGSDADDGCTNPDEADGRMVALKNHPIWAALGLGAGGYRDTLGNPWAPFAFNSGMNTIVVSRADCVKLGILGETQKIEPDDNLDLNGHLEASLDGFDDALKDALDGDGLQIVDGVLRLASNSNDHRASNVIAIAQEKSRLKRLLHHLTEAQ